MIRSRSRALALAAAVAACSTSPLGMTGPQGIEFSAAPAGVHPGGTVQLTLTNSSPAAITARPCPLALQRFNGFTWVGVPDGSFLCAIGQDTIAAGAQRDYTKPIDPSAMDGTYRAEIMIEGLGGDTLVAVTSNTFTVL